MSKTEKNLIRQKALARKTSASALLRQALRQVLEGREEELGATPSLLDKHQHIFVGLDVGPKDLSTNPVHLRDFGK